MALLRKRQKPAQEAAGEKPEGWKKKRHRLLDFFKSRRRNTGEHEEVAPPQGSLSRKVTQESKHGEFPEQNNPDTAQREASVGVEDSQDTAAQLPTPPPEPKEARIEVVSEKDLRIFFSGAPQFTIPTLRDIPQPTADYPWDVGANVRDLSDSLPLDHPAFSAATLRRHAPPIADVISNKSSKPYVGYTINTVEVPSMLSSRGMEPGTVGFDHFLQMSISDNRAVSTEEPGNKNGLSEDVRNREIMHNNPEKLGIRSVDSTMIHERLVEFDELWQALQLDASNKNILSEQSSGELYANLFGKFLTPPRFDPDAGDPTGLKVQIETLLRILQLRGIWFDFSLVEWRIRLGQVLWMATDVVSGDESPAIIDPDRIWSERDILLLQISLACELLLRLDVISGSSGDDTSTQVTEGELQSFISLKTRKTDWDLVLARRFLENIHVVMASPEQPKDPSSSLRVLFSAVLAKPEEQPKSPPKPNILFLPRHQSLQLSGLLHFAESLDWPNIDMITEELAQKLAILGSPQDTEDNPSGLSRFLDPNTPTSPSIYSTPLASPRSAVSARNSYFGSSTKRPKLSRDNTKRSVQLSPSAVLLSNLSDVSSNSLDIGGWLSRSYLTGLIMPGEAISHFLISTLLENDKLAISALGDTANLYGGFIYTERCWWSKSCIVSRVLSCLDGSVESMGWLAIPRLPSVSLDGWVTISSKELPPDKKALVEDGDRLADISAVIPGMDFSAVKPEDLVLPLDLSTPPLPSIHFTEWSLVPYPSNFDAGSVSSNESDPEDPPSTAIVTFSNHATTHTFALTYDISFISSFPCIPPSNPNARLLARTASKRITLARRSSHGFSPLASHPPDSGSAGPRPSVDAETVLAAQQQEKQAKAESEWLALKGKALPAHPLHASYKYRVVSVTEVLEEWFEPPVWEEDKSGAVEVGEVLVLDARGERDLELLARAWCAERGLHAIIGRVGRSCIGCCIREARGLGVKVVVRV